MLVFPNIKMAVKDAVRAFKNVEMPKGNSTSTLTQLPPNNLEAFIPGYTMISKFFLDALGFDITLLVSICFLLFGLVFSLRYAGNYLYDQFQEYWMSYIRVDSADDIYDWIMDWLASQKIVINSRSLTAKDGRENAWETVEGDAAFQELIPGKLINFSNWDAKVPPRFQPSFGRHRFFHQGRLF